MKAVYAPSTVITHLSSQFTIEEIQMLKCGLRMNIYRQFRHFDNGG